MAAKKDDGGNPAVPEADRARLFRLRDLAGAQIQAIEQHDHEAVNKILAAKSDLIRAFSKAAVGIGSDPDLLPVAIEVKELDRQAQMMLYAGAGKVLTKLLSIRSSQRAQTVYRQPARRRAYTPAGIPPDASRFFDAKM